MELNFRPVAKLSNFSEKTLVPGDVVVSCLYHDDTTGSVERFDVLASEEADCELPGNRICRWRHTIEEKDESEKEQKKQALQSTEEIFLSLYEEEDDEPGGEGEDKDSTEDSEHTRDILKFFLALQLERKRVLRQQGPGRYLHIKAKRVYPVPEIELNEELIREFQYQLPKLVGTH